MSATSSFAVRGPSDRKTWTISISARFLFGFALRDGLRNVGKGDGETALGLREQLIGVGVAHTNLFLDLLGL